MRHIKQISLLLEETHRAANEKGKLFMKNAQSLFERYLHREKRVSENSGIIGHRVYYKW